MHSDYAAEHEYDLDEVTIHTPMGRFDGRGFMRWKADEGFRVDAFLERSGAALPATRVYRTRYIETPDDTCTIRMRMHRQRYDWGVIHGLVHRENFELVERNRLRVTAVGVLFGKRLLRGIRFLSWHGEALYEKAGFVRLPGIVEKTTNIGAHVQTRTSRDGFAYRDDQCEIDCVPAGSDYLRLRWSLDPRCWSRREAWLWGEAAEIGLSVLCGQTVRLVQRRVDRGYCSFVQWFKRRPIVDLGVIAPYGDYAPHTAQRIVEFIGFLVGWRSEADVCRRMFLQMAEARRQETAPAQELLMATILEAALRTIERAAGRPVSRDFDVANGLSLFRQRYLSRRWKHYCKRVLDSYRRLRHRNAHPEWLATGAGAPLNVHRTQTLDDMVFLARFYGHMMTALAGWKDPDPAFAPSHDALGSVVTVNDAQ